MLARTTKYVPRQCLFDEPQPRLSSIMRVFAPEDWVEVKVETRENGYDAKVFERYEITEEDL